MIDKIKNKISDLIFAHSIKMHKTSMFWNQAKVYTKHWNYCKKNYTNSFKKSNFIDTLVEEFRQKGFTYFHADENKSLASSIYKKIKHKEKSEKYVWKEISPNIKSYFKNPFNDFHEIERLFKGKLGNILKNIFQCDFNIYFTTMQYSKRTQKNPSGSQLWHNDGGPGTCINVMFYISEASNDMGAIEILPWKKSEILLIKRRHILREHLKKFGKFNKEEMRKLSTDFYKDQIDKNYKNFIERPVGGPGLVTIFSNNTIHKGGFPDIGKERYVCIFHCYPSFKPADFNDYKERELNPNFNYPRNPKKDLR